MSNKKIDLSKKDSKVDAVDDKKKILKAVL
jgi:hypothetical protein